MSNQEGKQRQEIERLRELLRPSPVKVNHVPDWLRKRVLRALGPWGRHDLLDGFSVLQAAIQKLGIGPFDHFGSTTWHGIAAFVSEPYCATSDVVGAALFAERLDLEFRIEPNSWWYPMQTTRLLFTLPRAEREVAK